MSLPTVLTAGAILLLASGAVAALNVERVSSFDRARAVARSADRFDSGEEAGFTLLEISQELRRAGESCDAETAERRGGRESSSRTCQRYFAASAYAQVAAARVRLCTPATIFKVRDALARHLDRIDTGQAAPLPEVPRCA